MRARAWLRKPSYQALVLAFVLSTPTVREARADVAPVESVGRAARQFADGQKAFASGDYRRAAALFEKAYETKPHYSALWNAARSWERAGEDIRAANLHAKFLAEAPASAPDRDQATVALRALSAKLGRIELRGVGVTGLRLDDEAVTVQAVYVSVGEHLAEGETPAGRVRKVVHVEAGQTVSVTLALADAPPEPQSKPSKPSEPSVESAPPVSKGMRVLPPFVVFTGAALTMAAGGLAIASGIDTTSRRDAFLAEPTQARLDAGFASQTRTNIGIGVSVGLAVVTAAVGVMFTDWKPVQPDRKAMQDAWFYRDAWRF